MTALQALPADLMDPYLCQSPLWDSVVRDEVSRTKLTTAEINRARSRFIIPGSSVRGRMDGTPESRLPLILIQRPGGRDPRTGRLGKQLLSSFGAIVRLASDLTDVT